MPIIASSKPVPDHMMYSYLFGFDSRKEERIFEQVLNGYYQPLYQYIINGGDVGATAYMDYTMEVPAEIFNSGKPMYATFQGETTLLHAVALWESPKVIQQLADLHVDFNQYSHFVGDINGFQPVDGTLLHYTAINGDWKSAEIMLANHALPNIMNSSGDTVLDVAVMFGNTDYMHHLQDFIADHPEYQQKITHDDYLAQVDHEHSHDFDNHFQRQKETLKVSDVIDSDDTTIAGIEISKITTEQYVANDASEVTSVIAPAAAEVIAAEMDSNVGFVGNMWANIATSFSSPAPTTEVVI